MTSNILENDPQGLGSVQRVQSHQYKALSVTLADAFSDDPVTNWLVGYDDGQALRRQKMFYMLLKNWDRHGVCYCSENDTGAALWARPGYKQKVFSFSFSEMALALGAFKTRVPKAIGLMEKMGKCHPKEPHWYLAVIGTSSAARGSGYGTQLMKTVLKQCDEQGIVAYLESSNEVNNDYYIHHGFKVDQELTYSDSPPLFLMSRKPR